MNVFVVSLLDKETMLPLDTLAVFSTYEKTENYLAANTDIPDAGQAFLVEEIVVDDEDYGDGGGIVLQ